MTEETLTEKADRYRKLYSDLSNELDKPENLHIDNIELLRLRQSVIDIEREAAKQEGRSVREWARE